MNDIVSITDHIKEFSVESEILGENFEPNISSKTTIILVWNEKIDRKFLSKYKNIRAVIRYGVGFDNIDLDACKEANIIVANTPDYGIDEVSDTAMAMLLSLTRGINSLEEFARENSESWLGAKLPLKLNRLSTMTLGIIGLGRIGGSIARKFKAFSNNVIFYDPYIPSGIEKTFNIERCHSLGNLLKASDIVTINTPLSSETQNLIDEKFINLMKDRSILINVSRGPIVADHLCIYNALVSGKLIGYATDVFTTEPPNNKDRLYQAWLEKEEISKRIIITPHTAYYSEEALKESREKATLNCLNIINGKPILNQIA